MRHKSERLYKSAFWAEIGWWNLLVIPTGALLYSLVGLVVAACMANEGGYITSTGSTAGFIVWASLTLGHILWVLASYPMMNMYYLHGLTSGSADMIRKYEALPKDVRSQFPAFVEAVREIEKDNGGVWQLHTSNYRSRSAQGELSLAVEELYGAEMERRRKMVEPRKQINRQYAIDLAERMREEAKITRTVTKELL